LGIIRANLALIFSILALAISLVAFHQAGNQSGLRAEIENFQKKMVEVKEETADRLEKVRQDTYRAGVIEIGRGDQNGRFGVMAGIRVP
jgi:signal transduction histidine kinase